MQMNDPPTKQQFLNDLKGWLVGARTAWPIRPAGSQADSLCKWKETLLDL